MFLFSFCRYGLNWRKQSIFASFGNFAQIEWKQCILPSFGEYACNSREQSVLTAFGNCDKMKWKQCVLNRFGNCRLNYWKECVFASFGNFAQIEWKQWILILWLMWLQIGESSLFWRPLANLTILNILASVSLTWWKQSVLASFGQFEQNQRVFLFVSSMWLKLMKTIAFRSFWQLCPNWMTTVYFS